MKSSKLVLTLLTITVIVAVIKADNRRESSRSRTGNAETRLRGGYSHRGDQHRHSVRRTQALRARRPNETPIRPGTPARRPAVLPSSAWSGHRSSQAQRELLFVSPERFMQTRPRAAGTKRRGGHSSRASPQGTSYGRIQALEGRIPNGTPMQTGRPSTTYRPPTPEASVRDRLETSQSQRELKFVSPPRDMRRPDTGADGRRIRHFHGARRRGTQSRRKSSRVRRPNETPIRPGTPARRPAALPSPTEASAWGGPRSSQAQRELLFVSPERFMHIKGRPRTVGTNPRGGHSSRASPQGTNLGRMQDLGGRRLNETPMRPRIYLGSFKHTPKASARREPQSPSALIRISTVSSA